MNVLIIGASGAIGGVCKSVCDGFTGVDNLFTPISSEVYLGNLDERIYLDQLPRIDLVILAFGTYGGLKAYENNRPSLRTKNLQSDLIALLGHRSCGSARVVLYSSAVLENSQNLLPTSPYFDYATEKHAIEEVVQKNCISSVILRPTNIISRFENHNLSGHAVASIYRNIRDNAKLGSCEIWSHPSDWREFTTEKIISNTLQFVITREWETGHYKFAFGSGYKMYMSDLVNEIATVLEQNISHIRFSQPRKQGPLSELLSIKGELLGDSFNVDVISELRQVIKTWKKLDEDER